MEYGAPFVEPFDGRAFSARAEISIRWSTESIDLYEVLSMSDAQAKVKLDISTSMKVG